MKRKYVYLTEEQEASILRLCKRDGSRYFGEHVRRAIDAYLSAQVTGPKSRKL